MGRIKKYNNIEEKKEANRIAARKYYWNNKESIDLKMRKKYKKKNGNRISTP